MARLGDICENNIDKLNASLSDYIDYIDISSVDNRKKAIESIQTIPVNEAPSRAKQIVTLGDILVSTVRPNLNAVALVEQEYKNTLVASTGYCVLRCSSNVDNKYVYYFCQSSTFIESMISQATGASYPAVTTAIVKNCSIPLPPLDVQHKIAAVLDKINNLITKRHEQLDKLDLLVKAKFIEMFGDPFINPMKWEKIKIGAAVTVEPQNGMYKPQSDYVIDGSGTPILRIDGFYEGVVTDFSSLKRLRCEDNEKQKYLLKEDDIVINRVNSIEYLGKCAHITGLLEETVYESNMMRMHFDSERFNSVYVTHLLCTRFIYDQIVNHAKKAVNQASINQKDVLDFDIYKPPIELQNQFVEFVKQTRKSKSAIQQSLEKLEALKKSLMQQYFG